MAIPTITTDLTLINAADSTTGWSGWGQNAAKWSLESDIVLEGTGSVGIAPFQTGDGGYGYQYGSNIDVTSNLLLIWIYCQPGFVSTSSTYGIYIRVTDSTSTWTGNYSDWIVGGSDVAWVGRGWHLVALDCNNAPDRTTTEPTYTAIRRVGVGSNMNATASKSTILAIDAMYFGTYVEATGATTGTVTQSFNDNGASPDTITRASGSYVTDGFEQGDSIYVTGTTSNNGEYTILAVSATTITLVPGSLSATETSVATAVIDAYINFEGIYQKDGPTDDNWYGVISKNPLGLYEVNYNLYIGDQSGSGRTRFRTTGDVVYFADQPNVDIDTAASHYQNMYVVNDTGFTDFEVGTSSGTGDSRVGYAGSIFSQVNTYFGSSGKFDFSDTVDELEIFGAQFLNIGDGINFSTSTGHRVFNTTFNSCGPVTLGAVEARNLTFSGYTGTDGALTWNGSINIKNSSFLANRNDAGTAHAIYHGTASTYNYDNLLFSGNDYDIENASAGSLIINNLNGANASTYENTGGGSTTINTAVTLSILVVDTSNAPLEDVVCAIYQSSNDTQLMNEVTPTITAGSFVVGTAYKILSVGTTDFTAIGASANTVGLTFTATGVGSGTGTATDGTATETLNYSSDVAVYARIRKSTSGNTRYFPVETTGTVTSNGFSITITLRQDTIASS